MKLKNLFKRKCKHKIREIIKTFKGSEILCGGRIFIFTKCTKCGYRDMKWI